MPPCSLDCIASRVSCPTFSPTGTIEQVLLALPERVPERWNECEIRTRDAAIAALPSEFMVTTAARDLRQQILARESPPPEIAEERFPEAHSRAIDPDEGLQISNEYRASNTYRHIRDGLDKLRAFEKEWLNGTPTRIACAEVFPVVNDLSAFLSQPQDPPVAPDQAEQVENLLCAKSRSVCALQRMAAR